MTQDEALKLALEFLERPAWRHEYALANINQASTVLKEALANVATEDTSKERVDETVIQRHEQKPVAWRFRSGTWFNREAHWRYINTLEGTEGLRGLEPLYTTPPQRTWVALTDEERKNIMIECESTGDWAWELKAAQAIEAKLKEKNT